jgi:hypothetical protein
VEDFKWVVALYGILKKYNKIIALGKNRSWSNLG